ncbi:MAG: sigma-54-dependent Fis family transcriptional regulator [Colwellia sp.]|nr:sigma-54-dependent Fis family transcriptional regulator [Colwellia sp.]
MSCILVIDDRPDIRLSLAILLEDHHYSVIEADNPQIAQVKLKNHAVALILLDMNYQLDTTSGEEGLAFLAWLQNSSFSHTPTVAMTAWSNTDLVVKAMNLGANDFIEKPWRNKQLLHAVEQQLNMSSLESQNKKLKQQLSKDSSEHYVWQSPVMQQLLKKVKAVANTDVSILLTGDNGTGKSELARYIHQQSHRSSNAFISVNMGAISESLFESEMFGHKKGAFTDAKQSRIGRFELAETGTLFLDEIANIPLAQQAKLLRVLENGEYEVLGSSQTQKTNTRVISATNGNFSKLLDNELFREDLYYRLNTIEFRIPSLKERSEDILSLAHYFMGKFSKKYQRSVNAISPGAKQAMLDYHWPGNVREMSHLIERAVLLTEHEQLLAEDLHINNIVNNEQKHSTPRQVLDELPLMTLAEAEVRLVKLALNKTASNVPQAALLLGLTKASMYRRLEKYGLAKN